MTLKLYFILLGDELSNHILQFFSTRNVDPFP